MATFHPVRGVAPFVCAGLPLLRVVGSVLVQGSVSHHIHTRLPYSRSYKTIHIDIVSVLSLLGGSRSGMVVGPRTSEREALGALALPKVSLPCRERGGLRKPEEPASKPRSARIWAPWSPGWVIGYAASPLCKLSCLIVGDQRCPPPSLNLFHCPLVASPLLFAHCVVIGESGFASSLTYLLFTQS